MSRDFYIAANPVFNNVILTYSVYSKLASFFGLFILHRVADSTLVETFLHEAQDLNP